MAFSIDLALKFLSNLFLPIFQFHLSTYSILSLISKQTKSLSVLYTMLFVPTDPLLIESPLPRTPLSKPC